MESKSDASDVVEFIGLTIACKKLTGEDGPFDLIDVAQLVETFPWWKRVLAWCIWRTPVRRLVEWRFFSPYGSVRAKLRPRLTGVNLSSKQSAPVAISEDGGR